MFDKTYLLSPQGQSDYKAWIKKLTDIAAKEACVSATVDNDGETVLDFTMGSGSTGVACVNTNRRFIGIELDEGYFNIAKERIEKSIRERD